MGLKIVDINVLVQNCVMTLLSVTGKNSRVRTALAPEELRVILDPVQMGENLAAFLSSACRALTRGGAITIGTRFLPIHAAAGNEGATTGCALLYVEVATPEAGKSADLRAEGGNRPSPFRSLLGVVKKINGCARVLARQGRGERLNIYLPLMDM